MNRVYIKTYGCQMNQRDSEAVAAMLSEKGYHIVFNEEDADIILLNTCSVRDQAEQKAIGKAGHLISQNHRKNKKRIIGILGCMAQNKGVKLLDSLPDLDLIIGTQKFHQVPDYLDNIINHIASSTIRPSTICDLEEEKDSQNTIKQHLEKEHQVSAFVSIMQGCNMNCSFCLVPKTRGQERARSIEDIIEEIEKLASKGTKEITLLGQIVTSYGRREIPFKNKKSPFVQLIEKINDIKEIQRIRFTSPHPRGFKEDLIEAYRDIPKLCEYVHLPLQSGSDKILKSMNRPYTQKRYLKIIESLRSMVPNMYFSTDIIVGFPGETNDDFELTKRLIEDVKFDMAYIFKYSPRPNTDAESLGDPILKEIKEYRNQILLKIIEESSIKRNKSLIKTYQEVLVENKAKKGIDMYMGRTRGYRKVIFKGKSRLIGELIPVYIKEANISTLTGQLKIKD